MKKPAGPIAIPQYPNPDEAELKIEDCKLNIRGCRFAPNFFQKETGTYPVPPLGQPFKINIADHSMFSFRKS